MAFENTITEKDLDHGAQTFVNGLRGESNFEPDLSIDGLSDSFFSRLLGIFGKGRNR